MARDARYPGTVSALSPFQNYLSGFNIAETAVGAAVCKIRDSLALATTAPTGADGAAGNSTVGLHMMTVTAVTRWGESLIGARSEFTTAGSKIISLTAVPIFPGTANGHARNRDTVVGRRIYVTKAGAPATGTQPTNAQWFLIAADQSTTVAAGMNGMYLPGSSLTVASTTGFAAVGNILVTTDRGAEDVAYTSVDATHFLGCTGGQGLLTTGNAVTQPLLGDNTTTTYSWNVADASLTATNPPTKDTAGAVLERVHLAASESVGQAYGPNVSAAENDGGWYMEVTSGTVSWTIRGQ